MKTSYRALRIQGIDIEIHLSFLLLPLILGVYYGNLYGPMIGVRAVVLVLLVFGSVLAHELTHSIVARHFGILVPVITLYPIGGVASMQRIPREARKEFLISVAGPLFNFTLALLLLFPFYLWLGKDTLLSPTLSHWPGTWSNFYWANLVLGLFNLIPAFPMDGGRILRAILARCMNYEKATRISVYLGRIFAILFFLFGIWQSRWMLVLVGLFIYVAADNEKRLAHFEELLTKAERERKIEH